MRKHPVIKVLKSRGGGTYIFWCPFCNRFHFHDTLEGYSEPNCTNNNSPYIKCGGYILKECTEEEIEIYNLPIKR